MNKLFPQLPIRPVGACLALFFLILLGPARVMAHDGAGPEPVLPAADGTVLLPAAAGEVNERPSKPEILTLTADPFPDHFLLADPGPAVPQFLPAPMMEPLANVPEASQGPQDLPDLIVEDIWSTTGPLQAGQQENFSFRIKNQGAADAASGFKISLTIDGVSQAVWQQAQLAAGSTAQGSTTVVVNSTGVHAVEVIVDFENSIEESEEGNNKISESWFWATSPVDLTVLDLWSTTTPLEAGKNENIFFRIRNQGTGATAQAFKVRLWVDGANTETWDVASLGANAELDGSFNNLLLNTAGVHEMKLTVDYTDVVPEYDEGNNTRVESWEWAPSKVDLVVDDVWSSTEPVQAGVMETIKLRIRNQGTEATPASIRTRLWVDGVVAGTVSTSGLAAGATSNRTMSIQVDDPGPHEMKVRVDFENTIVEGNESNNERIETWTWDNPPVDLIVVDFSPETEPLEVGDTETVKVQIKNQGTLATSKVIQTRLWVDGVIAGTVSTSGLAAGATAVETLDIQVDDPGAHEMTMRVDYGNTIPEENEDNNERVETWTWEYPPVDLVVDEIWTTTDPLEVGQSANISYRIKNQGTADIAAGFSTQIWVDSTLVNTVSNIGLAAGATAEGTAQFQASSPGAHEVRVIVDYDGLIPETDETNNEESVTWTWETPPVDLTVEMIWSESEPLNTGEAENISFRVRNLGTDPITASFATQVWLDSTLLTTIPTNGLAAGAFVEGSTSAVVALPGPHVVKVIVDYNDKVIETDEANNTLEETWDWVQLITEYLIYLPRVQR